MRLLSSVLGGLAGAATVTMLHELMKHTLADAPRMDKLGMEAIEQGMKKTKNKVPPKRRLFAMALFSELMMNTLYYALAGIGKKETAKNKGTLLGLAAGLGSSVMPKPLGLSSRHSNKTLRTRMLAMGLYLTGGYIAAAVAQQLDEELATSG